MVTSREFLALNTYAVQKVQASKLAGAMRQAADPAVQSYKGEGSHPLNLCRERAALR